jgi:hypothetical protein
MSRGPLGSPLARVLAYPYRELPPNGESAIKRPYRGAGSLKPK